MSTQTVEQSQDYSDQPKQEQTDERETYYDHKGVKRYRDTSSLAPGHNLGRTPGSENRATPFRDGDITEEDLVMLESLQKHDLIALIKRVSGAIWGIGCKTDEEIDAAMRLKLAHSGLSEEQVHKYLPAIKEYYDRTKGKPAQSVQLTVKDDGLSKLSTEKLLRLAAMMEEPVLIAPMPGKLED
jgi:hypothetical protein